MYIFEVILFGFICLGAFNLYGWFLGRSLFWKGLSNKYSCTTSEFRGLPKASNMNGRFVFSVDDSWDSNDYIDVKITDEYIYLGVDFPLSFTVKALKIPRAQCVQEGTKTYYFKKRDVVSLPSDDSIKRKVALIP